MPKKITDEKQNLIRLRLIQGYTIEEIAEETQVSKRTVMNYKKNSPAPYFADKDTGDNTIRIDYSTVLTKREEKYAEKIKKELVLFEDEEEGWVYHITKTDQRIKSSGIWWSVIVYPESAPEHWMDKLRATQMECAISPLHDKDTWNHDSSVSVDAMTGEIMEQGSRYKVGDRKKSHWHVIVKSEQKTGYREMNDLLQEITHCPYIQKCRSLKNAYEYFVHLNDPNKYQYEKSEIVLLNNFHIEPNKYEIAILQTSALTEIREHQFSRWGDVIDYYKNDIETLTVLNAKPHIATQLIHENWRKENPDGVIKRVRLVNEKGENINGR